MTGAGGAVAENVKAFELTLPGLTTVTGTPPAVPGTVMGALNAAELMKVVVTALPLNMIVAPLTKPEPLTVSVRLDPTCALPGERLVITGPTGPIPVTVN